MDALRFSRLLLAILIALISSMPVAAQDTLTVDVSITEVTLDRETRAITITGTVTCSEPVAFVDVFAEVNQPVGRRDSVRGFGSTSLEECGPFSITVFAEEGFFGPGRATIRVGAFACTVDFEECASDQETTTVRLRFAKE